MAQANSSIATAPSCSTLLRKPLKLEELGKWIQSGTLEYLPSPHVFQGQNASFRLVQEGDKAWHRSKDRGEDHPTHLAKWTYANTVTQFQALLGPSGSWYPACGGGKSRFPSLVVKNNQYIHKYIEYKLYVYMLVPKMKTVQTLSTRRTQAGCFYGGFRMS